MQGAQDGVGILVLLPGVISIVGFLVLLQNCGARVRHS
jgi:hypothetical protein